MLRVITYEHKKYNLFLDRKAQFYVIYPNVIHRLSTTSMKSVRRDFLGNRKKELFHEFRQRDGCVRIDLIDL